MKFRFFNFIEATPIYFEPIINYEKINNTTIDYGEEFVLSGDSITFENPNISISQIFLIRYAEIAEISMKNVYVLVFINKSYNIINKLMRFVV